MQQLAIAVHALVLRVQLPPKNAIEHPSDNDDDEIFIGEPVYDVYGDELSTEYVSYGDPIFDVEKNEESSYDVYDEDDIELIEVETVADARVVHDDPIYDVFDEDDT